MWYTSYVSDCGSVRSVRYASQAAHLTASESVTAAETVKLEPTTGEPDTDFTVPISPSLCVGASMRRCVRARASERGREGGG